jgi:hypothetical protein
MKKEAWKKCPGCLVFTDIDESRCPRYGEKPGHELQVIYLSDSNIGDLKKKKKIMTKHYAKMEEKFPE